MEYPEIRSFVKTIENVIWVKPTLRFDEVINKYGYPVISKEISQRIYEFRITKSEKLKKKYLHGENGHGKIPDKWKFMIAAPFKIDFRCCNVLKKRPMHVFEKETGVRPFIGTMAQESWLRRTRYLQVGCNSYQGKERSAPLSFWREEDIWQYINENSINYSDIYKMGYERTGCMFCMFGVHMDAAPNRFQRMKTTHPKLYNYCINDLKISQCLDYMGIPYKEEYKGFDI